MCGNAIHSAAKTKMLAILARSALLAALGVVAGCVSELGGGLSPDHGIVDDSAIDDGQDMPVDQEPAPDPIAVAALQGLWHGKALYETEVSYEAPVAISQVMSYEQDISLPFGSDLRPEALVLPLSVTGLSDGTEVASALYAPGETQVYENSAQMDLNGHPVTMNSRVTLRVDEARFDSDGFRVVYQLDESVTYSGTGFDGTSYTLSGPVTTEANLIDGRLRYFQGMDLHFSQSNGLLNQSGRMQIRATSMLER